MAHVNHRRREKETKVKYPWLPNSSNPREEIKLCGGAKQTLEGISDIDYYIFR